MGVNQSLVRFSTARFVAALAAVGGGARVGLVAVPRVGTFLGMMAGAFLLGIAVEGRPLSEGSLAGVVAATGVLGAAGVPGGGLSGAVTALAAVEPTTLLVTLALGAFSGGFGAHLGDDVRDGLTAPVEDGPSAGGVTGSVGHVATGDSTATRSDDEDATDDRTEAERDSATDADRDRELVRESADE
jgi:hypothetical protein